MSSERNKIRFRLESTDYRLKPTIPNTFRNSSRVPPPGVVALIMLCSGGIVGLRNIFALFDLH